MKWFRIRNTAFFTCCYQVLSFRNKLKESLSQHLSIFANIFVYSILASNFLKWTKGFRGNAKTKNFFNLPAAPLKLVYFISGRRSRGERLLTYLGLPVATAALLLIFKVLRTLPQFYRLKVCSSKVAFWSYIFSIFILFSLSGVILWEANRIITKNRKLNEKLE